MESMRRWYQSLAGKVFLLSLGCMLPVIAVLLGLTWWSIGRGFHQHVRATEWQSLTPLAKVLEHRYGEDGGWSFLPRDPRLLEPWLRLSLDWARRTEAGVIDIPAPKPLTAEQTMGPPTADMVRPFPGTKPPLPDRLGYVERLAILDAAGTFLAGARAAVHANDHRPLRHDGKVVGYLALQPVDALSDDLDIDFLSNQARSIGVITVLAVVLSAGAGALMARHLRRSIDALLRGTAALANGAFDTRLNESRRDELGDLAHSFNQLGEALGRHEQARRQWVASSSHELRTPIAVLRAQIEAMQDGVRPTDRGTLWVLHREVLSLSKLVDDLYTLARAEIGRVSFQFVPVEPLAVLDDVLEGFAPRLAAAGLTVSWRERPAGPVVLSGDDARLRQVFANLVENSLRYTDPGGRLELAAAVDGPLLRLSFDDTAPGIGGIDPDRLFERFFRTETSRNRESGGSGLGLAICRSLVQAHGGEIAAAPSPLGGLHLSVTLPIPER